MNQVITQAIVLSRTNYQEADRILTLLTPQEGKIRVLAKGVRKSKSKLAGGVELFSINEIGFIRGKSELYTLTTARLVKHFDSIVQNIDRTMRGYELIKLTNKVTEDHPEPDYFDMLAQTFAALNQPNIHVDIIQLWFYAQLLRIAGHSPNLQTDTADQALTADQSYTFDVEEMAFRPQQNGAYGADFIKFLRLVFQGQPPQVLQKVQGIESLELAELHLIETMRNQHLRV